MIVRRAGGLTEFIPSPQEKRDGVLRDHALDLVSNLEARLRRIEKLLGILADGVTEFADLMAAIRHEEHEAGRINQEMLDAGLIHQERAT